jgi:hypothetical protein
MTDQPIEDREDAPERPEDSTEAQEDTGYGTDEGEGEQSQSDE